MLRSITRGLMNAACLIAVTIPVTAMAQDAIVTREGDERSRKIEAFLDGYLEGDFSSADTLFTPEARFYWADMSQAMSLDDWREAVALQHQALRDFKMMNRVITTTEYPEYGPWTYVWTNWQATSKATGKPLDLPLHIMYRWDGDRVTAEFGYFDKGTFEAFLGDTLARMEPTDAPCPWDWLVGVWKATGGPLPDSVVNWTKLDGKDFLVGEWVDANGLRTKQVGGWDPSKGTISFDSFGTDGSSMRMDLTEFPSRTKMSGTYRSRTADGKVGGGALDIEQMGGEKMVVRFTDADGTVMERVFTPAAEDDPMRIGIAPAMSANDWRTNAINEMHANYLKADIDAMKPMFAKDAVHMWGDPNTTADNAEWAEGLAMHHAVFKDISFENLYTMTGDYSDGNTWTATWFEWNGTDRNTGEKAAFLVHGAFRWDGDTIAEEKIFFDVDRFKKHVEAAMAQ